MEKKKQLIEALKVNDIAKAYELLAQGYYTGTFGDMLAYRECVDKLEDDRSVKAIVLLGDDRLKSILACKHCLPTNVPYICSGQRVFDDEEHLRQVHHIDDVMIKAIKKLMIQPLGEGFLYVLINKISLRCDNRSLRYRCFKNLVAHMLVYYKKESKIKILLPQTWKFLTCKQ